MTYDRGPRPQIRFGMGDGSPPPRDILVLIGVLFVTFTLRHFNSTALLPALLELTPLVWRSFFLWQVVTYPFVGFGAPGIWFLLELLILFWFGRDVFRYLRRERFWRLLAWACIPAALAAVAVDALGALGGDGGAGLASLGTFQLMQGQRMLLTVMIAAFAMLYGEATILLFFVLPVKARYFIVLELLFAFMAFLGSRDVAGFVGICVAVAMTYQLLSPGGLRRLLRTVWLRFQHTRYESKLRKVRNRRGLRGIDGGRSGKGPSGGSGASGGSGPWVH